MRWLDNLRQSTELLGDPARCVHICDREGDIWELFCLARELDTHFLVRRCSDRLAEDGSRTVASIMAEEKVRGLHWVAVRDDKGKLGSTQVEISYRRITVRRRSPNRSAIRRSCSRCCTLGSRGSRSGAPASTGS